MIQRIVFAFLLLTLTPAIGSAQVIEPGNTQAFFDFYCKYVNFDPNSISDITDDLYGVIERLEDLQIDLDFLGETINPPQSCIPDYNPEDLIFDPEHIAKTTGLYNMMNCFMGFMPSLDPNDWLNIDLEIPDFNSCIGAIDPFVLLDLGYDPFSVTQCMEDLKNTTIEIPSLEDIGGDLFIMVGLVEGILGDLLDLVNGLTTIQDPNFQIAMNWLVNYCEEHHIEGSGSFCPRGERILNRCLSNGKSRKRCERKAARRCR